MTKQFLLCLSGFILCAGPVRTSATPGSGPDTSHQEYLLMDTDRDIYIAGEDLFIFLQLRAESGSAKTPSRFAYVLLRGKHGMVESISVQLDGLGGSGRIYLPDTLSSGYYQLAALTSWMRNQGEQNYAYRDILVVNRFDQNLEELLMARPEQTEQKEQQDQTEQPGQPGQPDQAGLPDQREDQPEDQRKDQPEDHGREHATILISMKDHYSRRELVELDVSGTDPTDPLVAMQIVVARREALHRPKTGSLQPDGNTYKAVENHSQAGENHSRAGMASHAPEDFVFPRETTLQVISGKTLHTWTREGLPGVRVLLNTPDTLLTMLYCQTDAHGYFVFHLDPYYHDRELFLIADPATTNLPVTIEVHDKFELASPYMERPFTGILGKADYIAELQEMVRINKIFEIPTHIESLEAPGRGIPPLVYGEPAGTFFPRLYQPLDNLREISREITGPWRIRTGGGRLSHNMVGVTTRSMLPGEPVLFVDGIMTTDLAALLPLGSASISRIEIHNKDWYYGEVNFPGIVAIYTNNRDYIDLDLSPEPNILLNHAPRRGGQHYAPEYRERNDRQPEPAKPDLRQTLYWNPQVLPGEAIRWYTGDVRGEYVLRIHGRTAAGRWVHAKKSFTVQ